MVPSLLMVARFEQGRAAKGLNEMTQSQPRGRSTETRRYIDMPKEVKTLCAGCLHKNDLDDSWCAKFWQERDIYNDRVVVVECGGHTPCKSS